jgi:hypothetical protein
MMNEKELKRFQENYQYDPEALPLIEELYDTYGERLLCENLDGADVNHTLTLMKVIKGKLEADFLVSVCSTNDLTEEVLGLSKLFPNLFFLMDYESMIESLEKKDWIAIYGIMKPFEEKDRWPRRERTIYVKGSRWDFCPKVVRDHFLSVKDKRREEHGQLPLPKGRGFRNQALITSP